MEKKCFKCGVLLNVSCFYKHSGMKDGTLNKCKECCKIDVRQNYEKNTEYYKQYYKIRMSTPDIYNKHLESGRKYQKKYPWKRRIRVMSYRLLLSGKIKRNPCEKCGSNESQMHHFGYECPYNITWFCKKHHEEWHKNNGDFK